MRQHAARFCCVESNLTLRVCTPSGETIDIKQIVLNHNCVVYECVCVCVCVYRCVNLSVCMYLVRRGLEVLRAE